MFIFYSVLPFARPWEDSWTVYIYPVAAKYTEILTAMLYLHYAQTPHNPKQNNHHQPLTPRNFICEYNVCAGGNRKKKLV